MERRRDPIRRLIIAIKQVLKRHLLERVQLRLRLSFGWVRGASDVLGESRF